MAKTHTLIVRGVSKEEKNALKRLASKSTVKLSMQQFLLSMIKVNVRGEIEEYKLKNKK